MGLANSKILDGQKKNKRMSSKKTGLILLAVYAVYCALICLYFLTKQHEVPPVFKHTVADPAFFMDEYTYAESVKLNRIRNVMFFLTLPLEAMVLYVFITSHSARRLMNRLRIKSLPMQIFTLTFTILFTVFCVRFPFRVVNFWFARTYDISVQPFWQWLKEMGIAFAIDVMIWSIAILLFYICLRRFRQGWFYFWLVLTPLILFFFFIQPLVIDPLFNEYNRLSDSHLEAQILHLADEAGISADRVYEAKMAKKTNAINAYVNGIGPSLRIVLWDTLLERMEEDEILFIMAHEIGHYVYGHLFWSAIGFIIGAFFVLFLGNQLYFFLVRKKQSVWGLNGVHDIHALPVLLLIFVVLNLALTPVTNAISRQAELASDRYALQLTQNSDAAIRSYQKLAVASKSEVHPLTIVKWMRYTHPSIAERIRLADQYKRSLAGNRMSESD